MEISYEFVKGQKGKNKIYSRGFFYTMEKKTEQSSYWKCDKWRQLSCKGRGVLANGSFETKTEHNHEGNPTKLQVTKTVNEIKERAIKSRDTPQTIIAGMSATLSDAACSSFPTLNSIRRTIHNARMKDNACPSLPKTTSELVIPEKYKKTSKGDNFLIYDNNEYERIIIFGTKSNVARLEKSKQWCVDGTFKTVPVLFSQLFTIHGEVNGRFFPLIYALLQNKREETYIKLFEKVRQSMQRPAVTVILSDFELGVINACNLLFPLARRQGCFFHFRQSAYRKIQSMGLKSKYDSDETLNYQIKLLLSLAFVPVENVGKAFDILHHANIFTEEAKPFVTYFQETWLGQTAIKCKRRNPVFPLDLWNCHDATTQGFPRTNNFVESWHCNFKKHMSATNPTIWKFLDCILEQQNLQELEINQLTSGFESSSKKRKYCDPNARIVNVVKSYEEHDGSEMFLMNYLKQIANNL